MTFDIKNPLPLWIMILREKDNQYNGGINKTQREFMTGRPNISLHKEEGNRVYPF